MTDENDTPAPPGPPEDEPAPKRRRSRRTAAETPEAGAASTGEAAKAEEAVRAEAAARPEEDMAAAYAAGEAGDATADAEAEADEEDPILALQRQILDAALPHACIDGWTREMLAMAALEAGLAEGEAERAFPRGAIDAVLAYVRFVDEDMAAEMADLEETEPAVYENMRTREKIAIAIQVRLESQTANREAIRKGLRVLADPRYAPEAAKSLACTVDTVWRIAGDTSTDFNYYTKRGLLAGVYTATLLYWLNDDSEDQHKTWEFMRARIGEVLRIGQAAGSLGKVAERLPNPFRLCQTGKRRWREGPVFR